MPRRWPRWSLDHPALSVVAEEPEHLAGLDLQIDAVQDLLAVVGEVWRRSCLCRGRHNHDYADPCVMPTSAKRSLWVGVTAASRSA